MDENFAMGYAMGQDNCKGSGGDGLFGGGWLGILLLIALLGGGFGGLGFGGFGFGGGGAGLQGMATRADINEGFALQNITSGITAIQQGICDATYALNNSIQAGFNATQMGMMQGFNAVERGFCEVGKAISDCCCENRAAIAQVRYDMATQACDTRNLIQTTARDLIDNQNANFRALMDYQVNREMREKDAKIAELQAAALTAQQNAYITANQEAQTATLLRRLGADCPTPAFLVQPPTPLNFPTNGCGQVQFGYNGGCGCTQYS